MPTLEMVEKLKERANVSYDEAKTALEACGDDLLEAMIYLERMGKVQPPQNGGYYSTKLEAVPFPGGGQGQSAHQQKGEGFGDMMKRLWAWICSLIEKGNTNHFEVWKGGKRSLSVPVTVLVLLAVFCFWVVIPLLIIGLFCGCKYQFQGPELDDSSVNNVMDSAAKAADSLKNEVLNHEHKAQDDQGE